MVKFEAFGKWVLIVPGQPRAKSAGGIILPPSHEDNNAQVGKVVSIGEECPAVFGKGAKLVVGDTVLFNGRAARDVTMNDVKCVIVPAVEVYGTANADDDKR